MKTELNPVPTPSPDLLTAPSRTQGQRARQSRRGFGALALVALAGLAGCGGGVYVEGGNYVGPPPEISLAAAPTNAFRGDPVQLVAAVTAPNGIDYVIFYRLDPGATVRLGSVSRPPAQWDTRVPINAGPTVSFYATVCDVAGLCTNSAAVTINVF